MTNLRNIGSWKRAIASAVIALAFGACAETTTSIDQTWTAPTARAQGSPSLRKVVTMFDSPNVTLRHQGEDQLARDLWKRGVEATPSYRILGDEAPGELETVKAKLREHGYDGVVTMRIVDREKDVNYSPTFDSYWGGYHGYWGGWYDGWGWDGYAYTETTYRIETAAYSLKTGELVWSALTETIDPDTSQELINDTTKVIASELIRNGLAG